MSYGGLGHLHLETEPKDPARAAECFDKDLDLVRQIGNIPVQTTMHSLLGRCAIESSDLELARTHYEKSLLLATSTIERFHAYLGLLRLLCRLPDDNTLGEHAREFAGWLVGIEISQELMAKLKETVDSDGGALPAGLKSRLLGHPSTNS